MENYSINDILNSELKFKNINPENIYLIKNKDKYGGIEKTIKNININVKSFLTLIDNDECVLYWDYKKHNVFYKNTYNNKKELFVPDFNVLVNKDNNKSEPNDLCNIDSLLISVINEQDDFIVLSNDMYLDLSDEEKELYEYSLYNFSIRISQYKASNDYANKNGMKFMLWKSDVGFMLPNLNFKKELIN